MAATDKKIKVLVIEDDPMILDMYVHKFQQEGFEVVSHDRGDGVLEIAEKEQPDLILLDIILPGLDGFSVLQSLKENAKTKDLGVVMLTNLGQDEDKAKGQQMGSLGYIVKSSKTPAEVAKQVREFISRGARVAPSDGKAV